MVSRVDHKVSHKLSHTPYGAWKSLPAAHRLAHTARAWTSPWTALENAYGQLLRRFRRGWPPPGLTAPQKWRRPKPPAILTIYRSILFFIDGQYGQENPATLVPIQTDLRRKRVYYPLYRYQVSLLCVQARKQIFDAIFQNSQFFVKSSKLKNTFFSFPIQ